MKKSKLKTIKDFLALIVRRRWWIICTAVALGGLSFWFAKVFPKSYTSQTMISIQSRDVPTDFVKDLIGDGTDARLNAIQQLILSRTNLLKIASDFENQLPEYKRMNDENKVLKLSKQINIVFPSERRNGKYLPVTNFFISYRNRNPELAQKITARLAELFREQDRKAREDKVYGTAEFLDSELNKVSTEMAKSETALKALKQRYRYELPAELEPNLRTLDRLQIQKNANLEALDRFVTLKMNLEREISETPPKIPQTQIERANPLGNAAHNLQIQNYRKKEQDYNELIAKAKPDHPDVRRVKAELEQLKKDLAPEELAALGNANNVNDQTEQAMVPNPAYQSRTAQLRTLMTDIEIRQKSQKATEDEIAKFNQRLQSMPAVEQEMLSITRTNAELTKQHNDLRMKLEQANLAGSMESRQKGEQFRVIDPANYPMEPSSPSKLIILLVGFTISIVTGIGVAILVSIFDQRIWTHQELERAMEAPVLVEIPSMVMPSDLQKTRRKIFIRSAAGIFCGCIYCVALYYLYLKQSTVVRMLDPLFETIIEKAAK